MPEPIELLELLVLFSMMAAGGAVVGWLWLRGWSVGLLPPQRLRAVPWGLREVLFAAFLVFLFPLLIFVALYAARLFEVVYGPEFHKLLIDTKGQGHELAVTRASLWVMVMGLPFQVAGVLAFFFVSSGTLPYQLGVTAHRWRKNLLLGLIGWLVVTPATFLVNIAVVVYYLKLFQVPPEKHVFEQLARSQLLPIDWWLMALSAAVAAPVLEELFFRGVLLQYLARRWWGGQAALAGSLAVAIVSRGAGIQEALGNQDWGKLGWELQPILFVLFLAAVFEVLGLRFRHGHSAIFGTALLFAMAHAAWPSPVPLFPLGLVLGWLAYRTQSLVAPMLLHALFNSVSVVLLLLTPAQPENGKEQTTPERRPPATSISTFVPGSW